MPFALTTPKGKSRPPGLLFAVLCLFEIHGYVEAIVGALAVFPLKASCHLVDIDLVKAVNLRERLV